MKKKRNSSYYNSDQKLLNSYFHLLSQKLPADITVTELVDGAHVNKTTFYNHYENGIDGFYSFFVEHFVLWVIHRIKSQQSPLADHFDDSFSRNLLQFWAQADAKHRLEILRLPQTIQLLDQAAAALRRKYAETHRGESAEETITNQVRIRGAWGSLVELTYATAAEAHSSMEFQAIAAVMKETLYSLHQLIYEKSEVSAGE